MDIAALNSGKICAYGIGMLHMASFLDGRSTTGIYKTILYHLRHNMVLNYLLFIFYFFGGKGGKL